MKKPVRVSRKLILSKYLLNALNAGSINRPLVQLIPPIEKLAFIEV